MPNLPFVLTVVVLLTVSNIRGAIGVVQLDFRLTPTVIKPLTTSNVTLQCVANEYREYYSQQTQYSYYDGRYRGTTTTQTPRQGSIARLRIMKNFQEGWRAIAQLSDLYPTTVKIFESAVTGDGIITSDTTLRSYIKVNWAMATAETFGKYRCDAISFDSEGNAVMAKATELQIGESLNAQDMLLLLKHDKEDILRQMKESNDHGQEFNKTAEELRADIAEVEEKALNAISGLEDKLDDQNKKIKEMAEEWNETLNKLEGAHAQRMNEISGRLQLALDSGFLMMWPIGSYGLPAPYEGCVSDGLRVWQNGSRQHHTESTDRNKDELSAEIHLLEPVLSRKGSNNYIHQHFCMKTNFTGIGPTWPRGSYCINKKGECPAGFSVGYIRWDEEENDTMSSDSLLIDGVLPDGQYENGLTTIYYCCREDRDADEPIFLPSSYPFYLYRKGGRCQRVHGTTVSDESITFDTDNKANTDAMAGAHPDATINNIRLQLCFYRKA